MSRDRAGHSSPPRRNGPAGRRPHQAGRPVKAGKIVDTPRRTAFDVLNAVESRDAYANLLVPKFITERGLSGRDAGFVTELVYGTLRTRGFLDAVLARSSERALDQIDPRVLTMLRLGAYQLLYMRVPDHAAVSASVGVARVVLTDGPAKFVNAVLRRVSEHDEPGWQATLFDPEADPVTSLAIKHSHPEWIVRAYVDKLHDLDEVERALAANNERPNVQLAARPSRIERDALVNDVRGKPGQMSPYAVYLDGGDPGRLPAVRAGLAHVQDEGSQLAALALVRATLAGSDTSWLDLCAGPGGKAALLGGLAVERGATVTAVEISEHRVALVSQAVAGLPVRVVQADGRDEQVLAADSFDRILVDAPCTGLGALRRRPEARWRKVPSDIPPLTKLQRELLLAAARAARPGGLVAYVTCSPHLAETKVTIADAVRKSDLRLVDVRPFLPNVGDLGVGPTVQLWPHRQGTDAMFIALLEKN